MKNGQARLRHINVTLNTDRNGCTFELQGNDVKRAVIPNITCKTRKGELIPTTIGIFEKIAVLTNSSLKNISIPIPEAGNLLVYRNLPWAFIRTF